jgi:hypothetical protein
VSSTGGSNATLIFLQVLQKVPKKRRWNNPTKLESLQQRAEALILHLLNVSIAAAMLAVSTMQAGRSFHSHNDFRHNAQYTQQRARRRSPERLVHSRVQLPAHPREHSEQDACSEGSDYNLEAFGPVDVDPTLTESEWLRSQGIDPDTLDDEDGLKAPAAVLSLAEVSYNRDLE